MNKTYFPTLDSLLNDMKGNGNCTAKEGLNAYYLHTTEAQRGFNSVYAAGKLSGLDLEADTPLNDCIIAYAQDSERQGFINGPHHLHVPRRGHRGRRCRSGIQPS